MFKSIVLAGATAALVIGSIAVAQTSTPNDANSNPAAAAPADNSGAAPAASADQSGANTSTTTAGERG
jgi:hypothetical protein